MTIAMQLVRFHSNAVYAVVYGGDSHAKEALWPSPEPGGGSEGSLAMRGKRRVVGAVVSLALAAGLLTLVASPATAAKKSLSFGDAPTDWSVTVGEKDRNVGTVSASGINAKNIRYSLEGSSAFKIKARSGRVAYDGGDLSGDSVTLTITAKHRKGKANPATISVVVAVSGGQPEPEHDHGQAEHDHDHGSAQQGGQSGSAQQQQSSGSTQPEDYAGPQAVKHRTQRTFIDSQSHLHEHKCTNPTDLFTYKRYTRIPTEYDGKTYMASHSHVLSDPNGHAFHTDKMVKESDLKNFPTKHYTKTWSGTMDGSTWWNLKGSQQATDGDGTYESGNKHTGQTFRNGSLDHYYSQLCVNMMSPNRLRVISHWKGFIDKGEPRDLECGTHGAERCYVFRGHCHDWEEGATDSQGRGPTPGVNCGKIYITRAEFVRRYR